MNEVRILVVEDEALIAMHIKAILEAQNYEVVTCNSYECAISYIDDLFPSIVLIDINLNKNKGGLDIAKYLLKRDTIPYIYITSYADKDTIDRVNETRPFGYIVKPFKDIDVISTISIILNNYNHKEIDNTRNDTNNNDPIPFRLKEVIMFINENINNKLEIEELAAMTPWKRHHFMKLFSKYLKVSPYQYILSRKIEKSKIMLSETTIPINEIAFELGFNSYSNFCNAFKKNCQITAENFRKKNQKLT